MKKYTAWLLGIISTLLISMLYSEEVYSQAAPLFKLRAHTDVTKATWWDTDSIYRFPDFQYGRVTFFTGFSPDKMIRLNYNLYFGQMDLINEKGDTVQIVPSKELKLIDVGGHIFFYDTRKGYIEILLQAPVALGVWTILRTEKMDYVSGSIEGSVGVDIRGRPSVYDRYYRKTDTYFFIDEKNKLYKAIKPFILKLFPSHKEDINEYLQQNSIDFNSEKDLVNLVNFCNQLQQPSEYNSPEFLNVRAGTNISKAWSDSIYQFPAFQEAKVTFRDGSTQDYQPGLNYNFFTGEMDMINKKGDTVKIKNAIDITTVNIDGHMFYHNFYEGYVEVLINSNISLGVNKVLKMKRANFASNDALTARNVPSEINNKNSRSNYTVDFDRVFLKATKYFFIDQNNQMYPANEFSLLKLVPQRKATVSAYIRENNIDFKKEKDLMRLVAYCSELFSSN